MKYVVDVSEYGDLEISSNEGETIILLRDVSSGVDRERSFALTRDEFREFRRAIGYVWRDLTGESDK